MNTGIYSVDTASHGGIMIEAEYAKKILSPEAQKIGFREKGYLNFEEDCDANVAVRELLDNNIWKIPDKVNDKEKFESSVNNSIKHYYPEYWQSRENRLSNIGSKRYIAYDFLIGNPMLIDTKEKTLNFYGHNIYGQIYDLKNPETHKITARTINGLIKRVKNPDYFFKNAKAADKYIYSHFMTKEQQEQCGSITFFSSEKIAEANDFKEIIRKMCEWVYDNECIEYSGSEKESRKQDMLKYCESYLSGIDETKNASKDALKNDKRKSVIQTLNKNKKEVKPLEPVNKAKTERNNTR